MTQKTPYTYYACSCSGTPAFVASSTTTRKPPTEPIEDEQQTFDPTSPRANYSLYPLEQLLYCADCHESRCPRCITEEVVCWYCPSCLFEVPSSSVRSEGNRCTRSCYNCPLCQASLIVNSIGQSDEEQQAVDGPYILSCSYCDWSSLDLNITFEKHTNITGQLQRLRNARFGSASTGGDRQISQAERLLLRSESESVPATPTEEKDEENMGAIARDAEDIFASLTSFYKSQVAESGEGYAGTGLSDLSFSSPSSINRLLNMYSTNGKRAKKTKPKLMREALTAEEGLQILSPSDDDQAIQHLHNDRNLDRIADTQQRLHQDKKYDARLVEDLMPTATLLRTKRIKRCAACRQLVSRPEPKVSSTRYKFKTLALSHVPRVSLHPLPSNPLSTAAPPSSSRPRVEMTSLTPLKTHTFLLRIVNPIFEPIRVTLATPALTPGSVQSRITILCPQFEVGSNADVFEEAISGGSGTVSSADRRSRMQASSANTDDSRVAEAGKIWDQGRNWTRVVLEVVPGLVPGSVGYVKPPAGGDASIASRRRESSYDDLSEDESEDEEDEVPLEIPVFVRIEYETEAGADEASGGGSRAVSVSGGAGAGAGASKGEKEKRELAFWCVLGAGVIHR